MKLMERRNRPTPDGIDDGKPHPARRMTEDQFVAWAKGKMRAEWAGGEVIVMAPMSGEQADLCVWLVQVVGLFVQSRDLGIVRGTEFMVRLPRQRRRRVPDLLFVSKERQGILRPNHVEGAPDLIIEVVGEESAARDWRDKYHEYARASVKEYWVIDPRTPQVEAYQLGKGKKYRRIDPVNEQINSTVLGGFYLKPAWVRGPALANPLRVLRELGVEG